MTDRPERSLFERDILRPAIALVAAQARPAPDGPQPGHVRGRDRRRADHADLDRPGLRRRRAGRRRRPGWFTFTVAFWLWLTVVFGNFAEAIAEGRGKAQADALRAMRTRDDRAAARRRHEAGDRARPRRRRRRRGRRGDPRRRHRHRGHRLRRRVGHHRRVGAGHPRGRRRPQRGHRRHARALRPHRGRDHAGAGPVVPRPHDRARRGRRAAQDAERDRALDPARRPDDRVPRRRRHAAAVRASSPAPTSRSRS